jgi:hypothetical protein
MQPLDPQPALNGCSSRHCCRSRMRSSQSRRYIASPRRGVALRWYALRTRWAITRYNTKYEPVWNALEDTGMVYGMHPFPAGAALKPQGYTEQYSGAELIRRTISASGVPHSFLTNVQNFQSDAALCVTAALMSGLFERHPKLKAAVFEASSTWLSFLLDECDKMYRLLEPAHG